MVKDSLVSFVKKYRKFVIVILLLAFLVRIITLSVTLPYTHQLNDEQIFETIGTYFLEGKNFYVEKDRFNEQLYQDEELMERLESNPYGSQKPRLLTWPYSPFGFIFFAGIQIISMYTMLSFAFLLRFFYIFVDVFMVLLIAFSAFRLDKNFKLAGWIYALNPITIMIASFHGQSDVLMIFLAFLAWYCFTFMENRRILISGILLGFSVAFKHATIILIPLFLIKIKSFKERVYFVSLALLPTVASVIPYMFHSPESFQILKQEMFLYSGSGWGGLVTVFQHLSSLTSLSFFQAVASFIEAHGTKILLLALLILYLYFFKKSKDITLLESITITFLAFYILTPKQSVQYAVWFFPFILLALRRYNYVFYGTLISISLYMAIFYVYHAVRVGVFEFIGIDRSFSLVLFSMFFVFFYLAWFGWIWLATAMIKASRIK